MDLPLIDVVIPEGTTEITGTTFHNHRMVSSIKIPESVLVIGENAFADCVNLKSVELPQNLMAIGKRAFYNCASLESVDIPSNITTIEEGTFEDCTGLQSIVLHENITSINEKAFANCTGIKNLVLPDNLISCAKSAFPNSEKYLPINKNYKYEDGMMFNTFNSMLLFYSGSKKNVATPEGIKGIGRRAFFGTDMESVRIREGVISIGEESFVNCGSDTKVIIPESVDFIENSAFGTSVKIFCKKASYSENWCRNNPNCVQLEDEEF